MTTLFLIRHAMHDLVGQGLAGRMPGVHLNSAGRAEAKQLVGRLVLVPFEAIYASPRERAQETAAPLAATLRQEVRISEAADDIDFGRWTGRSFAQLAADPQWETWNSQRTAAQPPGGETMIGVQRRIVNELAALATRHANQTLALFTHCDVIKSALAYFLASSLDELERFEIAPASVSVVHIGDGWTKVNRVNDTGEFRA